MHGQCKQLAKSESTCKIKSVVKNYFANCRLKLGYMCQDLHVYKSIELIFVYYGNQCLHLLNELVF